MADERGTVYRSDGRRLLTPQEIRDRCFNPTRLGRRGLDPEEVHEFLKLVEVDLGVLHQELAATRDEAERLKSALRDWQSQHGSCYQRSRQDGHLQYRRPGSIGNPARPPTAPQPRERRENP